MAIEDGISLSGLDLQDVPQYAAESTSSVGGLWPPQDAYAERVKGIYTGGIISTEEDLRMIVQTLVESAENSDRENGNKITRISLRAIIDRSLLTKKGRDLIGPFVEALIPLDGTHVAFKNSVLTYVGLNHATRQPLPEELKRYRKSADEYKGSERPIYSVYERCSKQGLDLVILPNLNREKILPADEIVIDQVTQLYQRFGWDRNAVIAMLANPNNIVGAAMYQGQIVSAGIAEMVEIPVGKDNFRMAEITEAATLDGYGGNGLYTGVSCKLLEELYNRSKKQDILGGTLDLVFGECNGNAPGVLKTARIQDRTFSTDVADELGFPGSGILPQHVIIEGNPKRTKYNDLLPTFLTRRMLYNKFE